MTPLVLSHLQFGKEPFGQHLRELWRGKIRHRRKECKLQLPLADVHCSKHSVWKGMGSADPLQELPSLPGIRDGPPCPAVPVDRPVLPYRHV